MSLDDLFLTIITSLGGLIIGIVGSVFGMVLAFSKRLTNLENALTIIKDNELKHIYETVDSLKLSVQTLRSDIMDFIEKIDDRLDTLSIEVAKHEGKLNQRK